jgi:hypothetical protein
MRQLGSGAFDRLFNNVTLTVIKAVCQSAALFGFDIRVLISEQ